MADEITISLDELAKLLKLSGAIVNPELLADWLFANRNKPSYPPIPPGSSSFLNDYPEALFKPSRSTSFAMKVRSANQDWRKIIALAARHEWRKDSPTPEDSKAVFAYKKILSDWEEWGGL